MIKILILSRSDVLPRYRSADQSYLEQGHLTTEAQLAYLESHYVLFQEGDGPVTIMKNREDYHIERLLEEVVREMKHYDDTPRT
jgi:hypothetical protein